MFSKPSAYKSVNSSQMQFYHHRNINPNPQPPSTPQTQSTQSKVVKT
jgi:hypothetical protein